MMILQCLKLFSSNEDFFNRLNFPPPAKTEIPLTPRMMACDKRVSDGVIQLCNCT